MNSLFFRTFFSIGLILAAGCDQRQSAPDVRYCDLPDAEVLASVNGSAYTKADLERDVSIMKRIFVISRYANSAAEIDNHPINYRRKILQAFVSREVLLQEAGRRKIDLSQEEASAYQDQFVQNFSREMPLTFNALLEAQGKNAATFRNNLRKDALADKTIRWLIANSMSEVSKEEAARQLQKDKEFNANLIAENKALSRLATNAWKSIRAGNDFSVVGEKLTSMRSDVSFEKNFADKSGQYGSLVPNAIAQPSISPDGLEIVRANPEGTLSRILFRLQHPRELLSVEKTQERLIYQSIGELHPKIMKGLSDAAAISVRDLRQ